MTENQPPRPANMNNIVAINQGKRRVRWKIRTRPAWSPARFSGAPAEGHVLLDSRSAKAFGQAHIANAYSVMQDARTFEQAAGWILPSRATDRADRGETGSGRGRPRTNWPSSASTAGSTANIDMAAWKGAGLPSVVLPQIDVHSLSGAARRHARVLDVRDAEEWSAGHIDSAVYMNYKQSPATSTSCRWRPATASPWVCGGRPCARSAACSMLRQAGYDDVRNVTGRHDGLGARGPADRLSDSGRARPGLAA